MFRSIILIALLAFVVNGQVGPGPVLLSPPKNSIHLFSDSVTLKWSPVAAAGYYTIQISGTSDFSGTITYQSNPSADSLVLKGYTKWTPNVAYYWRVNAVLAHTISNWSDVSDFVYVPCFSPVLLDPSNNQTGINSNPVQMNWLPVTDASSYYIQVSVIASFVTRVCNDSTLSVNTKTITLLPSTIYYWRVRAKNLYGSGGWSSTWMFITKIATSISNPTINRNVVRNNVSNVTTDVRGQIVKTSRASRAAAFIVGQNAKRFSLEQ